VQKIGAGKVRHVLVCPPNKAEELAQKYPNCEVMSETGRAKGIYPQLNDGFNQYGHNCDYLGWLNDDDFWLPGFAKLIETVEQNPTLDFVYGKVKGIASFPWFSWCPVLDFVGCYMLSQQATLLKSACFFKLGGLSEKYQIISDGKLWADLAFLNPNYRYLNEDCAMYSTGENRISSDTALGTQEIASMRKEYKDYALFKKILAKALFRFYNMPLYLKRFPMTRKLSGQV
jgi:hypothetical protein